LYKTIYTNSVGKFTISESYDPSKEYYIQIDAQHLNKFNLLLNEISEQIGKEKIAYILDSDEYSDLCLANLQTFELVDAVKENPCLGKEVDASNYKRFLAKKALQERWFSSKDSELKMGYKT
jgi:uncharacterized protein YukJ